MLISSKRTILIIKTGYSETFCSRIDDYPSIGDVLLTTPLLDLFKKRYHDVSIDWICTSESSFFVESSNVCIYDWSKDQKRIENKKYDIVVNLEKGIEFLKFADRARADLYVGFFLCGDRYRCKGLNSERVESVIANDIRSPYADSWHKLLIGMFEDSEISYAYNQNNSVNARMKNKMTKIGLNYTVGNKWPIKAMSVKGWKELASKLEEEYIISWQEGFTNLKQYVQWIVSCDLIITQDSLGLHIAQAYRIPVISLWGPTSDLRVTKSATCISLKSSLECPILPCYKEDSCIYQKSCMEYFSFKDIITAIEKLLSLKNMSVVRGYELDLIDIETVG